MVSTQGARMLQGASCKGCFLLLVEVAFTGKVGGKRPVEKPMVSRVQPLLTLFSWKSYSSEYFSHHRKRIRSVMASNAS